MNKVPCAQKQTPRSLRVSFADRLCRAYKAALRFRSLDNIRHSLQKPTPCASFGISPGGCMRNGIQYGRSVSHITCRLGCGYISHILSPSGMPPKQQILFRRRGNWNHSTHGIALRFGARSPPEFLSQINASVSALHRSCLTTRAHDGV